MEHSIDNQQANATQLTANDFTVVGGAAVGERVVAACPATAGATTVAAPASIAAAQVAANPAAAPATVYLTGAEASGIGSPAEDPATQAASQALREGRLGYRIVKRTFDVAFSAAVIVCLSWLFALVAIAIKIDDPAGPVFFKQKRVGRDGREFQMYKFRSMCVDAEAKLAALREQNEKTGPVFKMAADPRVTRVGRLLRKMSIDELPQFINVLAGNMSVVGPRPALPAEVAEYTPRQRQRLLVKPGMTCYWQTRRNRDAITFDEWIEMDLLYIKKCSAWTDFKLVIQTIGVVLTAQGS